MGTTYRVQVVAAPVGVTGESLRAEVNAILGRIDRQFSTYRQDSEISRFNRADSTDWQPVSPDLVRVISAAERLSRLSQGAFDVTTAPLVTLWGFGPGAPAPQVPSQAEIHRVKNRVGYQKLEYRHSPPALRKRSGFVQLDVNALVPGYAADRIAAWLEQQGIRNYLVDMGGEFRLKGHNAQGKDWRIAIEVPLPDVHRPARVMTLTDRAMATSGSYRNYFEDKGKRYSHLLDARSGRPVAHDLLSVTVIGPTALAADAWATTLLILGQEAGFKLAAQEKIAALFITRRANEFEEKPSAAFRAYLAPEAASAKTALPPPE